MAVTPTPMVPVAAKVWSIDWNCDDVSRSRRNVAVASGADVGLVCFVGLHSANLNFEPHRVALGFVRHLNRKTPR